MKISYQLRRDSGFSLSEVALSLGIATVSLLTLISLLPVGLDSLRKSGNLQAEARITQAVLSSYQMEDGSGLSTGGGTPNLVDRMLFFDQAGTELEKYSNECGYVVQVKIGDAPSVQGDGGANPYLRQIRLRITDSIQDYESALADGSHLYHERSTWIALLEKTGPPATIP